MKINLENWNREPIEIFCDGVKIDCAIEADDIAGYVEFLQLNEKGGLFFIDSEFQILAKKRVYGAVRIIQNVNKEIP